MSGEFTFNLTEQEKIYLLDLARLSIARRFRNGYSEETLPPRPRIS
jgi:hypothetical protein